MPVALNSQLGSKEQNERTAGAGDHVCNARLHACIIQSFDPDVVTAVVQPAIKGANQDESGTEVSVNLPLLVDVPVIFPRGGGCTLTFLLRLGMNALLSLRTAVLISGGKAGVFQEPVDERMHDLSDAFCIVGPTVAGEKIGGISTSAVELRSDDGETKVEPLILPAELSTVRRREVLT